VRLFRRSFVVLFLVCLGCTAQSAPSEIGQKVEHQVRAYYNIPPEVKVDISALRPSDFPNYDALTVTMDGQGKKQEYEFLLAKDQKILIRMVKIDMTKDPYAEIMKKMDLANRPVRGNADAKVVVVNFDDFECPFCSRMHQTLFPLILKEYGDRVKFVYKDFPLSEIHPWAMHAAIDANCLGAQNNDAYWDFADYVHSRQREVNSEKSLPAQLAALDRITAEQGEKHGVDQDKLQACMKAQKDDAVKASIKDGENIGVSATPTLFINGQEVDGALSVERMESTLDAALARAGVSAPKHAALTPPAENGTASAK
jgi:protein-disulfide isomerase